MSNAVASKADQKAGAEGSAAGADRQGEGGGKDQLPAKMAREFLLGKRKLTDAVKVGLNATLHDRALVARILAAHKRGAKLGAAVGDKVDLGALVRDPKFDWGEEGKKEGGKKEGGEAKQGVQQRAPGPRAATDGEVHQAATDGLRGPSQPLPHQDAIQRSFGRHDVSGIQAHVGGPAQAASEAMGASAYATGNAVAFRESPDLHTAAHEAAHVVQQKGGVQLAGGVGKAGDRYEQHADAVADAVVSGKSAERLLDGEAGGASGEREVTQRQADGEADPGLRKAASGGEKTDPSSYPTGSSTAAVQRSEDDHHGVGGWIHKEVYEPLQRDYQAWMAWSLRLPQQWGQKVPVLGQIGGAGVALVPYVLSAAGSIVIGAAQLVTPKTEEEHFLFVVTAGSGVAAGNAWAEMKYGIYWFRALLAKRPELKKKIGEAAIKEVEKEVERIAPSVIQKVEGKLEQKGIASGKKEIGQKLEQKGQSVGERAAMADGRVKPGDNATGRSEAELKQKLDPKPRPGETVEQAKTRAEAAKKEIEWRETEATYKALGEKPPRINIRENDANFSGAHTIDRHGPEVPLRRTDAQPGVRTIEGRVFGDPPWGNAEKYSYRWLDESTMNRTVNDYLRTHWEQIRSDLAMDAAAGYEKTFDAGRAIGEGFWRDGAKAVYSKTSQVTLRIKVTTGKPPVIEVRTAFPNGRGF